MRAAQHRLQRTAALPLMVRTRFARNTDVSKASRLPLPLPAEPSRWAH